jgi:hypothetical protein
MRQHEHESWQTKHEVRFLNGLGTWITQKPGNRVELLQKYLVAWHDRESWGEIDKIEAREYAFTLLSNERLMAVRS